MANYGTAYRESAKMTVAAFNEAQVRVGKSTASLAGSDRLALDMRRNARQGTESVYRLATDMRILGIVNDEQFKKIRYVITGAMLVNYTVLSYTVAKAAWTKRKAIMESAEAAVETAIAAASGVGWKNIALASAATGMIMASFGGGYWLGRESRTISNVNIGSAFGQRMVKFAVRDGVM